MAARKSIVFISKCSPYGSHNPQLCLDMVLACAVFEQPVSYIFMNDGVYQLKQGQFGDVLDQKTLGNMLETLPLYGIDKVLVDAESLQSRAMDSAELVLPVSVVTREDIAEILASAEVVFNL